MDAEVQEVAAKTAVAQAEKQCSKARDAQDAYTRQCRRLAASVERAESALNELPSRAAVLVLEQRLRAGRERWESGCMEWGVEDLLRWMFDLGSGVLAPYEEKLSETIRRYDSVLGLTMGHEFWASLKEKLIPRHVSMSSEHLEFLETHMLRLLGQPMESVPADHNPTLPMRMGRPPDPTNDMKEQFSLAEKNIRPVAHSPCIDAVVASDVPQQPELDPPSPQYTPQVDSPEAPDLLNPLLKSSDRYVLITKGELTSRADQIIVQTKLRNAALKAQQLNDRIKNLNTTDPDYIDALGEHRYDRPWTHTTRRGPTPLKARKRQRHSKSGERSRSKTMKRKRKRRKLPKERCYDFTVGRCNRGGSCKFAHRAAAVLSHGGARSYR